MASTILFKPFPFLLLPPPPLREAIPALGGLAFQPAAAHDKNVVDACDFPPACYKIYHDNEYHLN